jgi:peptide/nickel transport system substrate-binding protein
MKKKIRRRSSAVIATTVAAITLAACGSGSSASSSSSSGTTKVQGGVATFAEGPGANPNYIFPLTPGTNFSTANLSLFQELMYRPLYWFGVGSNAEINYQYSLAKPPVFSNNNQTVTVDLHQNYKWSDGEPVDAQDVIFWMNLVKANKANWAAYVPGAFPDNITSYTATSKYQVVFQLDKSYNPTWFTYNELSQITPLPLAWDKTSLSAPSPTASTPVSSLPDQTTSGATAVYNFLNTQAGDLSTYATSPIWSIVDGPWKLKSFTTQGKAVFVPNPTYGGPVKPTLSEFVELPFTSDSAEFNVLRAKGLTYGYIPVSDLAQKSVLAQEGYTLQPWNLFGFNYWVENFNNPTAGPIFKQLYFRQAFQHLIDQQQWIQSFLHGLGVPTYSPVPTAIANPFADSLSKTGMYPYSISAAKSLLTSHGWDIKPNGVTVCVRPGTAANECGAGIAANTPLTFNLQYASGLSSVSQEMQALKSAAAQVGITINLSQAPFNQVISNASPTSTSWQMENWAGGWVYAPDYAPTGGEIFSSTAGSNFGSYNDPTADKLINETHTAPASQFNSVFNQYQNYMVQQLPVFYQPNPPFQLSEIQSNLKGVTQNPYANITPETWYFVK